MNSSMSRPTTTSRLLGCAAAALLLVAGLAGCTGDDSGLPSVGDAGQSTAPAGDDLEAIAESMYNCARDAGIPVEYRDVDGRPILISFPEDLKVMFQSANGGMFSEDVTEAEMEAMNKEMTEIWENWTPDPENPDDGPDIPTRLLIDGTDYSAAWDGCVASSGYDESKAYEAMASGPAMMALYQLQVDASNRWAECARANGFPDTKDAHLPTGTYGYPAALLPAGITEDQLRQLLEVCPTFDPAIEDANNALWEALSDEELEELGYGGYPEGYQVQPNVGFDYPGFDGENTESEIPDEATYQRLVVLQGILNEAQWEYYDIEPMGGGVEVAAEEPAG
jgi:hypothetical protein